MVFWGVASRFCPIYSVKPSCLHHHHLQQIFSTLFNIITVTTNYKRLSFCYPCCVVPLLHLVQVNACTTCCASQHRLRLAMPLGHHCHRFLFGSLSAIPVLPGKAKSVRVLAEGRALRCSPVAIAANRRMRGVHAGHELGARAPGQRGHCRLKASRDCSIKKSTRIPRAFIFVHLSVTPVLSWGVTIVCYL